jgi:hypothetical protein
MQDDLKNERLAEFTKVIDSGKFDIICLQEIFSLSNMRLRWLIEHAYSKGYHFHARSGIYGTKFPRKFGSDCLVS